jgi:2-dehydropantoate 2-reductase
MRIAVMAAGAVGGYFGARLAASGEEVHFIARGAHLEAIRARGLEIRSPLGDLHLHPASAFDDPGAIGPVDVVLFAVKLWDTEAAGERCRPLLGPDTAVVTLQNGIDSVERLRPILGERHVMGGVAAVSSVIAGPGVIVHKGLGARLAFGEEPGVDGGGRAQRLSEACTRAGIDHALVPDPLLARWQKFVFLVGISAVTTLMRAPIGPIVADDDCREFLRAVMEEAVAVGRAKGVPLAPDYALDRLEYGRSLPGNIVASMREDLERGNRLELPWLSGAVVRLGRELGLPTPANAAVVAGLKLHAEGAPPQAPDPG